MDRPPTWVKVIDPVSETCYWVDREGARHPGTEAENRAVRRELLEMRIISDKGEPPRAPNAINNFS
jgi:hypothetical protein